MITSASETKYVFTTSDGKKHTEFDAALQHQRVVNLYQCVVAQPALKWLDELQLLKVCEVLVRNREEIVAGLNYTIEDPSKQKKEAIPDFAKAFDDLVGSGLDIDTLISKIISAKPIRKPK